MVFWAFYYFIKVGGIPPYTRYADFGFFYESGTRVLTDPINLYKMEKFYYLPSAATFFAFTLAIFPLSISYYAFYFTNIVLGILIVREFNKILILLDIEDKFTRFLFLILISNGWFLHRIFTFNQTKLIVSFLLVLIIKREIQYRIGEREKDLKYYFINYFTLIFLIGLAPILILVFIIFLFNDINIRDFFKKKSIKIHLLIIVIFLFQNILFIIFPSLIFDYFAKDGLNWAYVLPGYCNCFFFEIGYYLSEPFFTLYFISSTIIIAVITIILAFHPNLRLETKIGFFSLSYLILGMFSGFMLCYMNMMFSLFLLIPNINKKEKKMEFIKENKLISVSLLIYAAIIFISPLETIQTYLLITNEYPFNIIATYRYVFLIGFYIISVILILLIKNKDKKILIFGLLSIAYISFIIFLALSPTNINMSF